MFEKGCKIAAVSLKQKHIDLGQSKCLVEGTKADDEIEEAISRTLCGENDEPWLIIICILRWKKELQPNVNFRGYQ